MNINKHVGSVYPEEMRARVIREKADLGISFDGDGDRLVMADEHGRLLDGNALLAMIGVDYLERDALPHNQLVTTIMANGGLDKALAPFGGSTVRTKVGDRYVVEAMRDKGLLVGGESSGHIVLFEHNTTGDAMMAALKVLAIMIRKDQPLSRIAQCYQEMPESHKKVPLNGKKRPAQDQLDALVLQGNRTRTEGRGRVGRAALGHGADRAHHGAARRNPHGRDTRPGACRPGGRAVSASQGPQAKKRLGWRAGLMGGFMQFLTGLLWGIAVPVYVIVYRLATPEGVEHDYSRGFYRLIAEKVIPYTEQFPFSISLILTAWLVLGLPVMWIAQCIDFLRERRGTACRAHLGAAPAHFPGAVALRVVRGLLGHGLPAPPGRGAHGV
jgi:hypothetical protein